MFGRRRRAEELTRAALRRSLHRVKVLEAREERIRRILARQLSAEATVYDIRAALRQETA